jgi:hypothetical protein
MGILRTVDFSKGYFECQKRKFTIHPSLGFVRWHKLQEFSLEFGFSATFIDIFKRLREVEEHLNIQRLFDAIVIINNLEMGIKSLDEKYDAAFRVCALFMNEEKEDVTKYDEGLIREKIDCWAEELEVLPFLKWAANCVPGWFPAYRQIIRDGSEKENQD